MHSYSVRHRCREARTGVIETFFEHWLIWARNDREAFEVAKRIPLDSRRRELVKVTKIARVWA